MAPSPITLWQIDGKKVETDFIFLGSKINVDGDDNHEIKRRLVLRRKVMTNLDSIFKSRDIANKDWFNQGKTSISALLTMPKPLTVWITRNCGKF